MGTVQLADSFDGSNELASVWAVFGEVVLAIPLVRAILQWCNYIPMIPWLP